MFSGKSEEMIRRLRRAEIAGQRVVIFKPLVDDRFDATDVVSHAGLRMWRRAGRRRRRATARAQPRRRRDRRGAVLRQCGRGGRPGARRGRGASSRPGWIWTSGGLVRPDARAPRPRRVRRQAAGGLPAPDRRRRPSGSWTGVLRRTRARRSWWVRRNSTRPAAATATRRARTRERTNGLIGVFGVNPRGSTPNAVRPRSARWPSGRPRRRTSPTSC